MPSSELVKAHSGFNAALKSYIHMVDRADVLDTSKNIVRKIARKKENSSVEIYDARLYKIVHERGK